MKVVITIKCNTEAFNGADCGFELARILRVVTERVDLMPKEKLLSLYRRGPRRLHDHDGKTVGTLAITKEASDGPL
jgi:hypothetical protein